MLKVDEVQNRLKEFLNPTDGKCTDRAASFNVVEGTYRSIFIQHINFGHALPREEKDTPQGTLVSFLRTNVIGSMTLDLFAPLATREKLASSDKPRRLELSGVKIGTLYFDFCDNDRQYRTSVDQISIERVHDANQKCDGPPTEAHGGTPDSMNVNAWLKKNQEFDATAVPRIH